MSENTETPASTNEAPPANVVTNDDAGMASQPSNSAAAVVGIPINPISNLVEKYMALVQEPLVIFNTVLVQNSTINLTLDPLRGSLSKRKLTYMTQFLTFFEAHKANCYLHIAHHAHASHHIHTVTKWFPYNNTLLTVQDQGMDSLEGYTYVKVGAGPQRQTIAIPDVYTNGVKRFCPLAPSMLQTTEEYDHFKTGYGFVIHKVKSIKGPSFLPTGIPTTFAITLDIQEVFNKQNPIEAGIPGAGFSAGENGLGVNKVRWYGAPNRASDYYNENSLLLTDVKIL